MASTQSTFVALFKPKIVFMQWVTVAMGFVLATSTWTADAWVDLAWLLLGTTGVSASAAILNNVIERDLDAKMARTKHRLLAAKKFSPVLALLLGVGLSVLGGLALLQTSQLAALIGIVTVLLYVLAYTPLKRLSWLNTFVGAIPGALPPIGGWAAATGELSWMAWGLFSILFFWQLPHFFAIDWMYKDDYKEAGMVMLSRYDQDGSILGGLSVLFSVVLTAVTLFPVFMGKLTLFYGIGILLADGLVIWRSYQFLRLPQKQTAKKLLLATVLYLPLLLMFIFVDHTLLGNG